MSDLNLQPEREGCAEDESSSEEDETCEENTENEDACATVPTTLPDCLGSQFRLCYTLMVTIAIISLLVYLFGVTFFRNANLICRMQSEITDLEQFVLQPTHATSDNVDSMQDHVAGLIANGLQEVNAKVAALRNEYNDMQSMEVKSHNLRGSQVNYAAEDLGAKILKVNAKPLPKPCRVYLPFSPEFSVNPPVNMLRPSMEPGNCFGFQGDKAEVTIKLADDIIIEAFELEHISARLVPDNDTTSAPRVFKVFGVGGKVPRGIGTFEYHNLQDGLIEQFPVSSSIKNHAIVVKFESNHGNPNYTCVYRMAVYGSLETGLQT